MAAWTPEIPIREVAGEEQAEDGEDKDDDVTSCSLHSDEFTWMIR